MWQKSTASSWSLQLCCDVCSYAPVFVALLLCCIVASLCCCAVVVVSPSLPTPKHATIVACSTANQCQWLPDHSSSGRNQEQHLRPKCWVLFSRNIDVKQTNLLILYCGPHYAINESATETSSTCVQCTSNFYCKPLVTILLNSSVVGKRS